MPRVYVRKFDWDDAARRYRAGASLTELGAFFGVRHEAIRAALVKMGVERRPASPATSVGEGELRCVTCHEWKPDSAFAKAKANPARRYRHRECRPCNTLARREHRRRFPELDRASSRRYRAKKAAA